MQPLERSLLTFFPLRVLLLPLRKDSWKVRENARRTVCLSNAKQIGLAAYMYSQDYDETWVDYSIGSRAPDVSIPALTARRSSPALAAGKLSGPRASQQSVLKCHGIEMPWD